MTERGQEEEEQAETEAETRDDDDKNDDGERGEDEDDEIECIIEERVHRRRAKFRVRYVGYGEKHDEWILAKDMLETMPSDVCSELAISMLP